ncbi:ROK family protein [Listeria costaricensis]|uniref:ROK family protein n=1 Tax=Listeria costaricensis TaxID=2026604 RepID=UPI000C079487|nr:ROK family protein [Listeria costaricensis]
MSQILAFDIGGTFIKYGIISSVGQVISKGQEETPSKEGGNGIVRLLKEIGDRLIDEQVTGIAISTAGQVDVKTGEIIHASELIPNFKGINLKRELESYFHLPVEVENDANCAALAEMWLGEAKGKETIFCLTLGTGIGGGYVAGGQLQHGAHYRAGEIGYLRIGNEKFEDLATPRVLIENVREKITSTEMDELTSEKIFELAKSGNQVCIDAIDEMMYHLSKGISAVCYLLNPEMIVIGGGISAQREYLQPVLEKHIKNELLTSFVQDVTVTFSKIKNEAGMIGAVYHFMLH